MKLFIAILLLTFNIVTAGPVKEVTNQDIRDNIISLVHSYHLLDNKLERHENRERALGEMIKKALQGLQKGQKAFEPMDGMFSRLDERVSEIETMLIANEEKLQTSLVSIEKWMKENSNCAKQMITTPSPPPSNQPSLLEKQNNEIIKKLDTLTIKLDKLVDSSKNKLDNNNDFIISKLKSSDKAMSELDNKLTNLYTNLLEISTTNNQRPREAEYIETSIKEINSKIKLQSDILESVLDKQYSDLININGTMKEIHSLMDRNKIETQSLIQDIKTDIGSVSESVFQKISTNMDDIKESIKESQDKIILNFDETSNSFYNNLNNSYSDLTNGLKIFNDFDKILLTTSEYILDTQKKIEFSTYQIVQKISEVVKNHNTDLNITLQKRLNDMNQSLTINNNESLKNFTTEIESEISHVWRQIQIMYSEITDSKDVLKKIQLQTENYLNGTKGTLNVMGESLGGLTNRMFEIDSNLNFLLGRLSLVTQEFKNIKIGLGAALDEIRNSFQSVQTKIEKEGDGPHEIEKTEYETTS